MENKQEYRKSGTNYRIAWTTDQSRTSNKKFGSERSDQ